MRRTLLAVAFAVLVSLSLTAGDFGNSSMKPRDQASPVQAVSTPAEAVYELTESRPKFQVTPMFAITEVKTMDLPYAKDTEKSFVLSADVNKQPSGDVDFSKVLVQVFFYDTVDHREIKPSQTFATQSEWLKGKRAKPDWKHKNPETLTVYYTRFNNAKPPSRDYSGYRILVYYDNRLQDQRADPPELLTVFPAPEFAIPPTHSDALKALAGNDYASAASLLQQEEEQRYAPAQARLASLYAQGKGVPRDYLKALNLYHKAMDQGLQPTVLNDFAWFLATCPDASQRDGHQAVDYAIKACDLTKWKASSLIDTLAAAFAETGQFDKAVEYEKQAISIPDVDAQDKRQMEQRVELYRHRTPYRQP
jgi:hypothetical protein